MAGVSLNTFRHLTRPDSLGRYIAAIIAVMASGAIASALPEPWAILLTLSVGVASLLFVIARAI